MALHRRAASKFRKLISDQTRLRSGFTCSETCETALSTQRRVTCSTSLPTFLIRHGEAGANTRSTRLHTTAFTRLRLVKFWLIERWPALQTAAYPSTTSVSLVLITTCAGIRPESFRTAA